MRKLALLLGLPLPAMAQEIVVTGPGLGPPPGDAAYAVTEIDRERLTDTASGRLEDVLRDAAGAAQFRRADSRSAHPTAQGITLRGLGGNASSRALLLLDGVPQADPFGGWVPFPAYLPERLANVRVTRGGGSGYHGAGALAGTVELTSAGPELLGPLALSGFFGSRESVDVAATSALTLGTGALTVAGQYARGDGFVPIVAEDRGPADRAAPYEQASLALRAVVPVGGEVELQSSVAGFTDSRDRGTAFTDIRSRGADASVRLVGQGRWRWSALAYLQHRDFASGFASVNATRTAATPALDQHNVPAFGTGARIELEAPMARGVTVRVGADARQVEGRTQERYFFSGGSFVNRRMAGGVNLTLGGFADLSLERGPLTLSAGGRIDRWRIGDGFRFEAPLAGGAAITDLHFANRSGWEPTGRVGAALRVADGIAVRVAGYRGWRLPALNELYRPFRVGQDTTTANEALTPETSTGGEVGLDLGGGDGFSIRTTLFWNRLDNAIANVTLSTGAGGAVTRQRRNIEAVEARGAEIDLRWRAGPWRASASWAYTDARVAASGSAATLNGLRPAQTARHQGSATLSWAGAGASLSLTGRYIGPQFEDDQNARQLTEAVTLDARLALPVTRALAIEARGENLGDARVETAISGTGIVERATPRTLWLGVRYRLR